MLGGVLIPFPLIPFDISSVTPTTLLVEFLSNCGRNPIDVAGDCNSEMRPPPPLLFPNY